ncbi:MAG TPA: hypothetical protein VJU82_07390 [Acidobacteriaceae bacterium]|nr:hypothetical protein [Acidobacteriaceae bacterium]
MPFAGLGAIPIASLLIPQHFNPYRDPSSAGAHTVYRFPGMLPAVIVHPTS